VRKRGEPHNIKITINMLIMKKIGILFCVFFVACQDDFIVPTTPSNYLYSGTIRVMQNPQIIVDGKAYENSLNSGPLQVTLSENKATEQFKFTVYGKRYNIYEADFWFKEAVCLEFNELEEIIFSRDERGNDVIEVLFHEDFWDDCYYEEEKEKQLEFLIKSRSPFF